ncbi:MAG: diguanylate cyclase, partial [Leptonema sp. (in: Bacteria)]|nr:diguanylate cyclase [Leptonema sp. (in: bacteria)]
LQAIEKQAKQKVILEEALDKSEHRFHQILEQTSLIAVMLNTKGEIIYSNPALTQKTGWSGSEVKNRNWYQLFVPQRANLTQRFAKAIAENKIKPKLEQEIITKNDDKLFIRWTNTIIKAEHDQVIGVVSLGEDTTEQRIAENALRDSENKLRTLFHSMSDIILVVDTNGQILEVAPTASWHFVPSHIEGRTLFNFLSQEQADFFLSAIRKTLHKKQPVTIEFSYSIRKEEHWFDGRLSPLSDNSVLIIIRDETERVLAQKALYASNIDLERRVIERTAELQSVNAQLRDIATRDELTGIANRRLFNEIIETEIRRAHREKRSLSLLLCDVDYFKKYNDHFGHQAGDDCLRQIGVVMAKVFRRAGDLPARYGGEEFAVILPGSDSFQALLMAERLRSEVEGLKIKHAPDSGSQYITLSLGISSLSSNISSATTLIETADRALYESKNTGRNQITVAPCNEQ